MLTSFLETKRILRKINLNLKNNEKKNAIFPIFSDVISHNSAIIRPVSMKFRDNYLKSVGF